MVDLIMPMLAFSILLIIVLVILLIVWAVKPQTSRVPQRRVKSDLRRIKEKIIDEDEI